MDLAIQCTHPLYRDARRARQDYLSFDPYDAMRKFTPLMNSANNKKHTLAHQNRKAIFLNFKEVSSTTQALAEGAQTFTVACNQNNLEKGHTFFLSRITSEYNEPDFIQRANLISNKLLQAFYNNKFPLSPLEQRNGTTDGLRRSLIANDIDGTLNVELFQRQMSEVLTNFLDSLSNQIRETVALPASSGFMSFSGLRVQTFENFEGYPALTMEMLNLSPSSTLRPTILTSASRIFTQMDPSNIENGGHLVFFNSHKCSTELGTGQLKHSLTTPDSGMLSLYTMKSLDEVNAPSEAKQNVGQSYARVTEPITSLLNSAIQAFNS